MRYAIPGWIAMVCLSCSPAVFKAKWTKEIAPPSFAARFETTKGSFDVQVTREWSPLAADRFYQLIRHHYFDSAIFYRVIPNQYAQFGSSDTNKMAGWEKFPIADEEVVRGNARGRISFARSGKETRGTDVYLNLKNNSFLDTLNYAGVKGFPSFGEVVKGMEVVAELYAEYGERSAEQRKMMHANRSRFLATFPGLDKIVKAYLLKD